MSRNAYLPPIGLVLVGLIILLVSCMTGCASTGKQPDLPGASLAEHVETTRQVYVAIDPALTLHPAEMPTGEKPSDAPEVAKARGGLLLQCWTQLDAIGGIEGTELKPKGKSP